MSTAPIALFVYNRPEHTRQTIEALQKNLLATESELFIFSDGAKNAAAESPVQQVRTYIQSISGFKKVEIITQDKNRGLATSIISGVTDIVTRFDKVIILEDDLVTSPHFLTYMNEALDLYQNEPRVASIHGYVYPVRTTLPETFFLRGADCWGWATWKRAWNAFEPDGKKLLAELGEKGLIKAFNLDGAYNYSGMLERQIAGTNDSWAIRWHAANFIQNKLTLYPGTSLVNNIGRDKSGTHTGIGRFSHEQLADTKINVSPIPLEENKRARQAIINYFRDSSTHRSILSRIIRKIFLKSHP